MTDLLKKYIDNSLSNNELTNLQREINAVSDDELANYLQELWQVETGENVLKERITTLKHEIDRKTKNQSKSQLFWKVFSRAVAVIAIPMMLATAYFLYEQAPAKPVTDMMVSVGSGERVNLVLPDGTKVNLNSESTLSYDISTFNKKQREVALAGEAYFEVAKNEKVPFLIGTSHLNVEVLGTTFNLLARNENESIELSLIEGKVHLVSSITKEDVVLYSKQCAVLDKNTGKISVFKANNNMATAWRRSELAFQATPVSKVLREIERSYGITIELDANNAGLDDLFTGTFSTKNLEETLAILKMHYRFNYSIDGNVVHIDSFKLNKRPQTP